MKNRRKFLHIPIIISLIILGIPGVDAITVSNETPYPENISLAPQNFIIFNPVPGIQVGQPLKITRVSDAPDGTRFLLTGESFYYRMHSHQKGSDFTHDTFISHGKIHNRTTDRRDFSEEINTRGLRPGNYFVTICIDGKSCNKTQIHIEPNRSQLNQEIILNPLKSDYLVGDFIHFSGWQQIPDAKTLYAELAMDPAPQNLLQDNRTTYLVEDIPLKESKIPDYYEFEGEIGTADLHSGNYTLQVISFNQQGDGMFAMNQTRISLADPASPVSQQKSANPFVTSLLLITTAIIFVLYVFRRVR